MASSVLRPAFFSLMPAAGRVDLVIEPGYAGSLLTQRRKARLQWKKVTRARSNGAITFVQRFNSALELSLHFHMLVPDGRRGQRYWC